MKKAKKPAGRITKMPPRSVAGRNLAKDEDHLVLYAEYRKYTKWAFLRDPNSRGHYKKMHRAGNVIECAICGAMPGYCCVNPETGATTLMHSVRIDEFYGRITHEMALETGRIAKELRKIK